MKKSQRETVNKAIVCKKKVLRTERIFLKLLNSTYLSEIFIIQSDEKSFSRFFFKNIFRSRKMSNKKICQLHFLRLNYKLELFTLFNVSSWEMVLKSFYPFLNGLCEYDILQFLHKDLLWGLFIGLRQVSSSCHSLWHR